MNIRKVHKYNDTKCVKWTKFVELFRTIHRMGQKAHRKLQRSQQNGWRCYISGNIFSISAESYTNRQWRQSMLRLGDGGARPEGPKPEARRAEAEVGSWGRWQLAPLPTSYIGGLGEHCKLPQWGPGRRCGRSPRPLLILVLFEPGRTHVETTIIV